MSSTRATRIFGPALPSGSPVTLYTVPAGKRLLVRDVSIVNNDGAVARVARFRRTATANTYWYRNEAVAPNSTVQLAPWWVLDAGDTFIFEGNNGAITVGVSGYLLDV